METAGREQAESTGADKADPAPPDASGQPHGGHPHKHSKDRNTSVFYYGWFDSAWLESHRAFLISIYELIISFREQHGQGELCSLRAAFSIVL